MVRNCTKTASFNFLHSKVVNTDRRLHKCRGNQEDEVEGGELRSLCQARRTYDWLAQIRKQECASGAGACDRGKSHLQPFDCNHWTLPSLGLLDYVLLIENSPVLLKLMSKRLIFAMVESCGLLPPQIQ